MHKGIKLRRPQKIRIRISHPLLDRSYSNSKLTLIGNNHSVPRNEMKATSNNGRQPQMEIELKILEENYLRHHWSDLTQI